MLSDDEERADRDDRDRLRSLDAKLDAMFRHRQEMITEFRRLSSEQKMLYDNRRVPQEEVERLYDEHGRLGKRLAELRGERDRARQKAEEAVIRRRELKLSIGPGERLRPEQIKREIAELELKQQTLALPLDEENALIAHLRSRSRELKEAEARASVAAEHERLRKEADAAVLAARSEVERVTKELDATKLLRDQKMAEVRKKLESAGGVIAELRMKGKARADLADRLDTLAREMAVLEREGREILARSRARRDEARRTLRAYSPHGRGSSSEEILANAAEAHLEELLKRGKVTLGG
jgi:SMC interacting uncharacterized protein involved in chromosome segregation